jgi:hypothetical protein
MAFSFQIFALSIFGQNFNPTSFIPQIPKEELKVVFPIYTIGTVAGVIYTPVSNAPIEDLFKQYNLPQKSTSIEQTVKNEINYCFENSKINFNKIHEEQGPQEAETFVNTVRFNLRQGSERSYREFRNCIESNTKKYIDLADSAKRSQCPSGDFASCQTTYFNKFAGACERAYQSSYKKIYSECIKKKINSTTKKHKVKKSKRS